MTNFEYSNTQIYTVSKDVKIPIHETEKLKEKQLASFSKNKLFLPHGGCKSE